MSFLLIRFDLIFLWFSLLLFSFCVILDIDIVLAIATGILHGPVIVLRILIVRLLVFVFVIVRAYLIVLVLVCCYSCSSCSYCCHYCWFS